MPGGHGHHGCYMIGTRIRTAHGEVTVDTLQTGDQVSVRRNGEEIQETVKWVGYSSVDLARHVHVEEAAPIRIRQSAIADDQPARDLVLSPEHCLILNGVCVPAKLLVNGGSIVSERNHAPFTYYHVELDRHGILLAENTPAESYLDTGNRSVFNNSAEPRPLYPAFRLNADASRWVTDACAPLAKVLDEVEPIWRRLAERSVKIGYPIPAMQTTEDAGLHVVADDRIIRPMSADKTHYVFLIPPGATSIVLASRFCIPSDKMISSQRDTRRLGVCVNWISIWCGSYEVMLPADHPALEAGWNAVERDAAVVWRWTDGKASIPWRNVSGSALLTVRCTCFEEYPIYNERTRLAA